MALSGLIAGHGGRATQKAAIDMQTELILEMSLWFLGTSQPSYVRLYHVAMQIYLQTRSHHQNPSSVGVQKAHGYGRCGRVGRPLDIPFLPLWLSLGSLIKIESPDGRNKEWQ